MYIRSLLILIISLMPSAYCMAGGSVKIKTNGTTAGRPLLIKTTSKNTPNIGITNFSTKPLGLYGDLACDLKKIYPNGYVSDSFYFYTCKNNDLCSEPRNIYCYGDGTMEAKIHCTVSQRGTHDELLSRWHYDINYTTNCSLT